ncbi:MAG TPA: cellulase family glycosylhydrolase, partial [Chloroflexota bacterium]|nr:cellulase family glycosylhydrolase [Chloroflexota bacterium]
MFRPNRLIFISLAGILVTSVLTGTGIMRGATTTGGSCGPDYGWLTTRGTWIVSYGDPSCRVRLAGATWYGFQSTNFAPVGLDSETYQAVLSEIARLGFNSVRIPLSDQLVKHNKSITIPLKWLKAEPKPFRRNLHPLKLLDDIVKQAADDHLMVILDNHFSRARDGNDVSNTRNVRFGKHVKKAPGTACVYTT